MGTTVFKTQDMDMVIEDEEEEIAADCDQDEFYIIYDGLIKVELDLDDMDTFSLDYLTKGSVIRANHCLVNRPNIINYRVCERVLLFSLKLETMVLLSLEMPALFASMKEQIQI